MQEFREIMNYITLKWFFIAIIILAVLFGGEPDLADSLMEVLSAWACKIENGI